jgi:hypothetical protein
MARVSSLRFMALEAGREGTKGCLALIYLHDVLIVVVLVVVRRPAALPKIDAFPHIFYTVVNQTSARLDVDL